ncbi:MAG: ATP-binding protein, partial [bacterium]
DIAERKQAEQALRESEERLQDFLDNANDLIQSVSPDGRILYVNRAWKKTLGYTEDEIADLTMFDVIFPDEHEHCKMLLSRVMGGEPFFDIETVFLAKDGKRIAVSGSANCRFEDGKPVATRSIFRDVTRQKQAEEDLREAKEAAEAANRAKSDFLANMSHELRTPLNSIIGFSNILLKNKKGNLKEQDISFLERVLYNGKHLLELINDILDLSKVEAGRVQIEMDQVDLVTVIRETVAQFEGQVQARNIDLLTEIPNSLATIESDPGKIKQMLINLIGNALKFTEKGYVTVRVVCDPNTNQPSRIDVIDTGIGIPKEKLSEIFDAFRQADSAITRKYGGTGLGLSISRSFCQMLGYDLTVDSEIGKGSIFSIVLRPYARTADRS